MTASAKSDTPRTLLQIVRNAVREFFAPCGWVRINRLERELTAARAEAEALRKDASELQELRRYQSGVGNFLLCVFKANTPAEADHWLRSLRDHHNSAIDAARSERGKE